MIRHGDQLLESNPGDSNGIWQMRTYYHVAKYVHSFTVSTLLLLICTYYISTSMYTIQTLKSKLFITDF